MSADLPRADQLRAIQRDRSRCLRCGRRPATFQHRRAKGMSGVGPTDLTLADGCALCWDCNGGAESRYRAESIRRGWKIPRFCPIPATEIPVYDKVTGNWWLLDEAGGAEWISNDDAEERIARVLAP